MIINPYAIVLLVSAAISLSLAPLVWHRKLVPGAKWFALVLLSVGEWCLTYAIEILVISLTAKYFWV
jgi:hypothetical protein